MISGSGKNTGVRGRLKWTIIALIAVEAGALGLKAWHDRQNADIAKLSDIQRDTLALKVQLNGKAEAVLAALEVSRRAGLSSSETASAIPDVDAVVSLRDASQSPRGSRLKTAANTAERLAEKGLLLGLSSGSDVVLIAKDDRGATRLAITPVGTWLVKPEPNARITLSERSRYSLGSTALDGLTLTSPAKGPVFRKGKGFTRAAAACMRLRASQTLICKSQSHPLLTLDDLVGFLIYALLLAAPALAIFGLMGRVAIEVEEEIIEETREDEADRIMNVVMHGARAGYWEWKPEENALYLSDGAATLLGTLGAGLFTIEDLLSQVHPRFQDNLRGKLEKSIGIGWVQTTFPTASKPVKWIELRGSLTEGEADQPSLYGGIAMDITERKVSEDRVKAAERRLRNAIEGFTGPFALWDNRKRLLYWNRAFALDFGLQDMLRPGISHDTVIIARAGAVRSEKTSYEDTQTTLVALNSGRWLKLVERSTADGGMISIGLDVTENIRNEEELKNRETKLKRYAVDLERSEGRADALSRKYSEEKAKAEHAANTKSAFLANMSHELRTPLNAINGFSEIIANELYGPLGDERYKGYAADILTSGEHLLDMINDILDMAKIEAGKMTINPQPIDPVDPVDAAVRMIRRKAEDKGIELVLNAIGDIPDIEADHRAIRQMILNLVSNAIKFTDAGGRITVEVKASGREVRIAVTDTGIGIPESDLPRLAKPFEQVNETRERNYEGTGLGLALTKSFAEMHGGRMQIASEVGVGTTVAFYLPVEAAVQEEELDVA